MSNPRKAVFLDRDGTVSVEMGYIHEKDMDRYALNPGAAEGMKQLADAGYLLILVTNQSGVARGYYDEAQVHRVHARLAELLAEKGVALDAVYYCPHHADSNAGAANQPTPGRIQAQPVAELIRDCDCRKPRPGMGLKAAADFDLDLSQCWVVGDKKADLGLAQALECPGILVTTGYGQGTLEKLEEQGRVPRYVAGDLVQAAAIILSGGDNGGAQS